MLIPWLLTTSETLLQTLKGTWELRASRGPELRQKQRLWDWQAAGNGPWSRLRRKELPWLRWRQHEPSPSYAVTSTSAVLLCFLRTQKASLFLNAPSPRNILLEGSGEQAPIYVQGTVKDHALLDSCVFTPWKRWKCYSFNHVWLFSSPWIVACQAPLSIVLGSILVLGYPRQEYWSGLPFPSPRDLPHPGIKLGSPALQADSLLSEPPARPEDLRTPAGHRASASQDTKDTTPFLVSYFFSRYLTFL